MPTATETPKRRLRLTAPPERHVAAWRLLLGLDRGNTNPWPVRAKEVRYAATPDRSPRPKLGANTDVWELVRSVRQDSADLDSTRRAKVADTHAEAVDQFVAWMDAEDFGDDPLRMRREAWR